MALSAEVKAGLKRAGRVILSGAVAGAVAKVSSEFGADIDAVKIGGFISLGGLLSGVAKWARAKWPSKFWWLPV